jgi:hypothetical protein
MWSFCDGWGRNYSDSPIHNLMAVVRRPDRHLIIGTTNESQVTWYGESGVSKITLHLSDDNLFMVVHTGPDGTTRVATVDDDPGDLIGVIVRGERRVFPAAQFVTPVIAAALVVGFVLNGGLDPTANWQHGAAAR